MSNNNVLDAALSIIVACHTKRKKLTHKTKKTLLHHVQERFFTTYKRRFIAVLSDLNV